MKNLAIAALLALGLILAPTGVSAEQVAASTSTGTMTFDGYYGSSGGGRYWSIAGGGTTSCEFQALTGDAYLVFAQSSTQKYEFFVPRGTTSYSDSVPMSTTYYVYFRSAYPNTSVYVKALCTYGRYM